MSSMEDRQKTFETKFAHDDAMLFKVEARTCKLFGLWVAEQIGLDADTAKSYAGEVVSANLEEVGYNDVIRKVRPDIDAKGLELSDHMLNTKLEEYEAEAKEQLMSEVK
jgi:hypothetical protein|tara:strand:+ start:189 stop:515 length:327 start_codon:yes stop_codon:yes gene_type:complete